MGIPPFRLIGKKKYKLTWFETDKERAIARAKEYRESWGRSVRTIPCKKLGKPVWGVYVRPPFGTGLFYRQGPDTPSSSRESYMSEE